jgi:2,3-dihydroxybiphenyl 1,2-dioxygenase
MHHEMELGYLVLEVPVPTSLNPVFADVVGLIPGAPTASGGLTWRDDGRAHRVIVERGPKNDAVAVGFEVGDPDAFERTVARLESAGYAVGEDSHGAATRQVARLARAKTPLGLDAEIVLGLGAAPTPFLSPLVPGGFLTDGVGFGHVVFVTTAFEETVEFLTKGLGFEQSDWLEMDIAEGITLEVRFYHCNQRHHTIALARAPFELPQLLHHVMFETNDRDDVGAAFDRLWRTELGIPNGLGRHDNDGMFSFYLQTPVGFQVEVGHGARVIDDDWNDDRKYDAISAWGHQPLRQA